MPERSIWLPLLYPLRTLVRALYPDAEVDAPGPADTYNVAMAALATADHLATVITDFSAAWYMGLDDPEIPVAELARHWRDWAWRERPPPVLAALIASSLVHRENRHLSSDECVPMAQALTDYVHEAGITSWAGALEEADRWWDLPASRDLVWGIAARTLTDVNIYQQEMLETLQREADEASARAAPWEADDGDDTLRTELANARAEADRLRRKLERHQASELEYRERYVALEQELRRRRAEGPAREG